MKKLYLAVLAVLAANTSVFAQSLNDQTVLANDLLFQQRVKQSIITAAINISSEGLTRRHSQARTIMDNPDRWKAPFAGAIATQSTVNGPATVNGAVVLTPMPGGNADVQQALVSDAVINTAVAAVFNAFFGGQ